MPIPWAEECLFGKAGVVRRREIRQGYVSERLVRVAQAGEEEIALGAGNARLSIEGGLWGAIQPRGQGISRTTAYHLRWTYRLH